MIWTSEHLELFKNLSNDCNPLHTDSNYAKRTQFGQVVVFGVCSILYGLGLWAKGRRFNLKTLRADFSKPLFLGENYSVSIKESENRVKIEFKKLDSVQSRFTFEWSDYLIDSEEQKPDSLAYPPRFSELFNLSPEQLPTNQFKALLWSSYYVGMVSPGRQALYTDFEMKCADQGTRFFKIDEDSIECSKDQRFNRVTVQARALGISEMIMGAFERPPSPDYTHELLQSEWKPNTDLKGKVVFISGASRGFGSVLARAFGYYGCKLVLSYHSSDDAMRDLQQQLAQNDSEILIIRGDIESAEVCADAADQITRRFGHLDLMINNACPHIPVRLFREQTATEFHTFFNQAFRIYGQPMLSLISLIKPGGKIVNVSSVYTQHSRAGFSHYIAAKSAIEGLTKALAQEYKQLQFYVARPPRMHTDQTNVAFDYETPDSPVKVAKSLIEQLYTHDQSGNYFELNLL